jgi:cysteine-rich repeat protein
VKRLILAGMCIAFAAVCGLPNPQSLRPPCSEISPCSSYGDEFAGHRCVGSICVLNNCGNGSLDEFETCDDANAVATDACTTACQVAVCGDGIVRQDLAPGAPGFEACDDANLVETDGCTNTCTLSSCGDGIKQASEPCDDGNLDDADACTNSCEEARCGDGRLRADLSAGEAGFEVCDDGNQDAGDGCSDTCQSEVCGDGQLDAGEGCDDGNAIDGDGCGALCQSEVAQIAAGGDFTCARLYNGTLRCWGNNEHGQLGAGLETRFQALPVAVEGLPDAASQVSAGSTHACAVVGQSQLYCWGMNFKGQIGLPEAGNSAVFPPVKPLGDAHVSQIAAGHFHSCAILSDTAEVRCWGGGTGNNDFPVLGDGSSRGSGTPTWVKVDAQTKLTHAEQLIIGGFHTCAILGRQTNLSERSNPTGRQTACWGNNGDMRAWRQEGEGMLLYAKAANLLMPLRGEVSMGSAGLNHTCFTPKAFGRTHDLYCMGSNLWGQAGGILTDNSNLLSIAAGQHHTCYVTRSGRVRCWGINMGGQLGFPGLPGELCRSDEDCFGAHVCEIQTDQPNDQRCTVACTEQPRGEPTCDHNWTCDQSAMLCRGGPRGDDVIWHTMESVELGGIVQAVEVTAGNVHSCARTIDNQVYCWGGNGFGQVGIGSPEPVIASPQLVESL